MHYKLVPISFTRGPLRKAEPSSLFTALPAPPPSRPDLNSPSDLAQPSPLLLPTCAAATFTVAPSRRRHRRLRLTGAIKRFFTLFSPADSRFRSVIDHYDLDD